MTENQNDTTPQKSENEIADYYDGMKKLELEGYETGIKKARNALFVTAGLLLIGEVISFTGSGAELSPILIGFLVFEIGSFIGLAFWTKTKPFAAVVTGLILFVLLWILTITLIDTSAIYKGILVRIIIIATLVTALKPAKAWEDAKKNQ